MCNWFSFKKHWTWLVFPVPDFTVTEGWWWVVFDWILIEWNLHLRRRQWDSIKYILKFFLFYVVRWLSIDRKVQSDRFNCLPHDFSCTCGAFTLRHGGRAGHTLNAIWFHSRKGHNRGNFYSSAITGKISGEEETTALYMHCAICRYL